MGVSFVSFAPGGWVAAEGLLTAALDGYDQSTNGPASNRQVAGRG